MNENPAIVVSLHFYFDMVLEKKDIRELSRTEIEDFLVGIGEKKFRASQIYE